MSYKKHGGLHFASIGRLGFSWHIKRRAPKAKLARTLAAATPALLGMDYLTSTCR